jgi:hypothetical protein
VVCAAVAGNKTDEGKKQAIIKDRLLFKHMGSFSVSSKYKKKRSPKEALF